MASYEVKEEKKKVETNAGETESKMTMEKQTSETPETKAKNAAATSGEAVGRGIEKVKKVANEFIAGVSKGEKAEQQPMKAEQVHQETKITQEAPQTKVVEEKVKKKEVEQS
jgi:hypothetical protein